MLPSFEATAQQSAFDDEFNLGWEHNFGDVYITTAPLFHDDAMFVRTSASWGGNDGPLSVLLSTSKEIFYGPLETRTQRVMIWHLSWLSMRGNGACGSWPNMLIIGWSDGLIEAREPADGSVLWTHQSKSDHLGASVARWSMRMIESWVPTRSGVVALCASNGAVEMEASTGLGWRNGVSVVEGEYLLGDEGRVCFGPFLTAAKSVHWTSRMGKNSTRSALDPFWPFCSKPRRQWRAR